MTCCEAPDGLNSAGLTPGSPDYLRYRRILWAALIINAVMFVVEVIAAMQSQSVSLLADSIDFFGDAANYLVSLLVLSASLTWRARTAMVKGVFMMSFGLFVAIKAILNFKAGVVPEATTMGVVGSVALIANVTVAVMLFRFRNGDANMQSVWLCSRNDALSNLAVIIAAFGVFGTASGWPDLIVAAIMAILALSSARIVIQRAREELATGTPAHSSSH